MIYLKTLFSLCVLLILVSISADLIALPPPALPPMPDQAPIDGGLGLLVVAGGAYAWKKLKSRNS